MQNFTKNQININFSLFSLILRITNFSYQIDEGYGTSCQPRPTMLHPKIGGSSIIPVRKSTFFSLTSLLVYQQCELEHSHKIVYLSHQDPK